MSTPKISKTNFHSLNSLEHEDSCNFVTPNSSPIRASRIPIARNSSLRKTLSSSPRVKSTTATAITSVWSTVEEEQNYEKFETEIDGYFNTQKSNSQFDSSQFNSQLNNSKQLRNNSKFSNTNFNDSQFNDSHGDASKTIYSPIQSPKPNYHLPPLTHSNFTPLSRSKITNSTPRVTHVLKHLPFVPTIIDYCYTAIFCSFLIFASHLISNNYKTIKRVMHLVTGHYFPGMHPLLIMVLVFSIVFILQFLYKDFDKLKLKVHELLTKNKSR